MRNRTKTVNTDLAHDNEAAPNVLFELWRLARAAGALVSERALAGTGVGADEFGIYSLLCSGEEVTPRVMERWMAAAPTTVSSYIKRLEARGHISRTANPYDRRSVLLQLTPAGLKAHALATERYIPVLDRVVQHLGPNEPVVRNALAMLREAINAARTPTT
jgi:DNA-binding MarR family transcriptional regulator